MYGIVVVVVVGIVWYRQCIGLVSVS